MISERDAMAVLAAESELQSIEILVSAWPISELGRERFQDAIDVVRDGLAVLRPLAVGRPRKAA